MNYIAHGDFTIPLIFWFFWSKYVYAWSFQNGAPNLDGIIRLPGRLLSLLVFFLFGNLPASYFYIGFSFLLVFLSFYLFIRYFFGITDRLILLIGSIIYTFNPVFLSNVTKVGLVAAAGLFPLCLLVLKRFIETRDFKFLICYILLLNYSLLHPFTFVVNAVFSSGYLIARLIGSRYLLKGYAFKLAGAVVLGIFLNAYFILPLASIGSIDKTAISQAANQEQADYLSLLAVANTKDILTAFSLSKDVFLTFRFYTENTRLLYMVGVYSLYVTIVALYLSVQQRLTGKEKEVSLILFGGTLILHLLTTGTYLASAVLTALIRLPGGWIFRSPLKWQLYIPFLLFSLLVLLVSKFKSRYALRLLSGALIMIFCLYATFLFTEIGKKLIKPKSFKAFDTLSRTDLDNQTLLYISGKNCSDYASANPDLMGEFKELAISRDLQVKTTDASGLSFINLASYDFILACKDVHNLEVSMGERFKLNTRFDGDNLRLYKNTNPKAPVSTVKTLFTSPEMAGLSQKAIFADDFLNLELNIVSQAESIGTTSLSQIFGAISSHNIQNGQLVVSKPLSPGPVRAFWTEQDNQIFYRQQSGDLFLSTSSMPDYQPIADSGVIELSQGAEMLTVYYSDPNYRYQNLVMNPSFEMGKWQERVADCFNYDDQPVLDMKIDNHAEEGKNSLALIAGRHLACTRHKPIDVKPGAEYLFELSYQSNDRIHNAGAVVVFNDRERSMIFEQPRVEGQHWHRLSKIIQTPAGADQAVIYLYGYPSDFSDQKQTTRYDNLRLVELPPVTDNLYVTSGIGRDFMTPRSVSVKKIDPTKRRIQIQGGKGAVVLRVEDTYHPQWRLGVVRPGHSDIFKSWNPWWSEGVLHSVRQFKLNNFESAWYFDTDQICQHRDACKRNQDGSQDYELVMEFWPQRWFRLGLMVSSITAIACFGYFLLNLRKRTRRGVR